MNNRNGKEFKPTRFNAKGAATGNRPAAKGAKRKLEGRSKQADASFSKRKEALGEQRNSGEDRDDRLKGRNAITEALNAGRQIEKIWLNKDANFDPGLRRLLSKAKDSGVIIVETDVKALERLVGANHQGIVAQVAVKDYIDFDLLLAHDVDNIGAFLQDYKQAAGAEDTLYQAKAEVQNEAELLIMLDQIQDPHNLGAVLRVADALGVTAVILPKHRAATLDATVARTSCGAIEHVSCAKVTNLANAISKLQKAGYWVVGADMAGENIYRSQTLRNLAKDKLVLVIGNEGSGISQIVKNACDVLVSIPMYGQVNSLNASVATAIVAYEVKRLRTLA